MAITAHSFPLCVLWHCLLLFSPVLCTEDIIFTVSSLSYSPGFAGSKSRVSVVFAPSEDITPIVGDSNYLQLHFPESFSAVGSAPTTENCESFYSRFGENVVSQCRTSLSFDHDQLLEIELVSPDDAQVGPLVAYLGDSKLVQVPLTGALMANVPIKLVFCCMRLPEELEGNSASLLISLQRRSAAGTLSYTIPEAAIMWTPRILAAPDWSSLSLAFNPARSRALTSLVITIAPNQQVPAGSTLHINKGPLELVSGLPDLSRLEFTFLSSESNLFGYFVEYSSATSCLVFHLASNWPAQVSAEIHVDNIFWLPASLPANDPRFTARVLASDGVTELVSATAFFQSEAVLGNHVFLNSEFTANGEFRFALDRDLQAGHSIVLRLPGYAPSQAPVPLTGASAFLNDAAVFDSLRSDFTLVLAEPLLFDGSGTDIVSVRLRGLVPPIGQYENDPSLRAAVVLSGTGLSEDIFSAIAVSPAFGVVKQFLTSSLMYEPALASQPTKLTITFRPSVTLTSGTLVVVHLRGGFTRTTAESTVPLYGASAELFAHTGTWLASERKLTMQVAADQVVTSLVSVWVPPIFVLPTMLSENDGILLIETSSGVILRPESIKTSPRVGTVAKRISQSAIAFVPAQADTACTASVSFSANTDLLAGSGIVLHLGGFTATGNSLALGGAHAPSFASQLGTWDAARQDLTMTLSVAIPAGTLTEVTVSGVVLPRALRANDESLWLTVSNMGISDAQIFGSNDRINNQVVKSFSDSSLSFTGDAAPYPGHKEPFRLDFTTTVDLLAGAVIRLELPGFRLPAGVAAAPVVTGIAPLSISTSSWDNERQILSVVVNFCPKNSPAAFTVGAQLEVPVVATADDPRFRLSVGGAMWIPPAPVMHAMAVIAREFTVSTLSYTPKIPKSVTMLSLTLKASVGLWPGDELVVALPGFSRLDSSAALGDVTVKIGGAAVSLTAVSWTAPEAKLRITLGDMVPAATLFELKAAEAVGFVLPAALAENAASLTVGVTGSIAVAPIKLSPLVGDGPAVGQTFCLFQFETAPRTHVGPACDCADADPCVSADLAKCGCPSTLLDVTKGTLPSFQITGFNLRTSDSLSFVQFGRKCDSEQLRTAFQVSGTPVASTEALSFPSVRALEPGRYTVCLDHLGTVFSVGSVTVRPKCAPPLVGLNGACFRHCPSGSVPRFGECRRLTTGAAQNSQTAIRLGLVYANADSCGLTKLAANDSTRKFFEFRLVESLESVTGELGGSGRFVVSAVSAGAEPRVLDTVMVTVVVTPGNERPSDELVQLLQAMIADRNSLVYSNEVLKNILPDVAMRERTMQYCAGAYRPLCPSPKLSSGWQSYAVIFGGLVSGLAIIFVVVSLYRLDAGVASQKSRLHVRQAAEKAQDAFIAKKNDFSVIKVPEIDREFTSDPVDVGQLDAASQVQLARDWLDGKLMHHQEPLILKRRKP